MNILIAPDKFKGSLTAAEVAAAIHDGLEAFELQQARGYGLPQVDSSPMNQEFEEFTIRLQPLADGGDGTLSILKHYLPLKEIEVDTIDPLGRPMKAAYLRDDKQAFIELAAASGLALIQPLERNVMQASSIGTGLLVQDALEQGCQKIYLLLGGSATNDLGLGIAWALGFRFLDAKGVELQPCGQELSKIKRLKSPPPGPWQNLQLQLFCDVENPLFGPNGAAHVYAAQKGASSAQIIQLDKGLRNAALLLEDYCNLPISTIVGGGAAGGIAAGMAALLNGQLQSGFDAISELSGLREHVKWADVVISGEGQLDQQSLQGKVVSGLVELCQEIGKPLHLLVGNNQLQPKEIEDAGISSVFAIMEQAKSLEDAMANGIPYLKTLTTTLTKQYLIPN